MPKQPRVDNRLYVERFMLTPDNEMGNDNEMGMKNRANIEPNLFY